MKKTLKITLVLLALLLGQTAGATLTVTNAVDMPVSVSTLKKGARGAEVTALQEQLKALAGIYPEGLVTGYFGTLTEKAVMRLQAQYSLEQVGFVGPRTRELLLKLSKLGIYSLDTTMNSADEMNNPKVAPQIFELKSMVTSSTSAYVFWTTNKYTTSEFLYANTTPLASTTPTVSVDGNLSFTHSVNVSNLQPNTTYYYMVRITDNRGNKATSTEKTLQTLAQ